ncbi:MAG TPA: hypothetical protein VJI98_02800 [Candidatus Nanoarchaeia archaeon]|nr:hypothetical protein [Candidatus Nanoarchaeia archaeon]
MTDHDLKIMDVKQLKQEIIKLHETIRRHRDAKGNDRCWLDDVELYQLLPEGQEAEFTLPEKNEFLKNCEIYWENRCPLSNLKRKQ